MIIVEGTDLVGKTKFCKLLAERFDTHIYQHLSRPPLNFDYLNGYLDLMAPFSIRDRFHISEPVYQISQGLSPEMTPEMQRIVDAHLRLACAYTVVITCVDCELEKRYKRQEREEMFPLEVILRANKAYESICNRKEWKGYSFDVDCQIHCTKEQPFPIDGHVDHVVGEYLQKQHLVRSMLA